MSTRYTVVQYIPDEIADERINAGVILWDEAGVRAIPIQDNRRVRAFGISDSSCLRSIIFELEQALRSNIQTFGVDGASERLRTLAGKWDRSIHITAPRGSIKPLDALAGELAETFLHVLPNEQPSVDEKGGRSHRAAAAIARRNIVQAVQSVDPKKVKKLVRKNEEVRGDLDQHTFDVVLRNGKLLGAVQALSFEVDETTRLGREIDATAWMLADMSKQSVPLGVFVLPPAGGSDSYQRARRLFKKLGGELLTEKSIDRWTKENAFRYASGS